MSRRKPPLRRWRIGDACRVPTHLRIASSGRTVVSWSPAEVVSMRGDRVVVSAYGFESERPAWELREPRRHRRPW